MCPTVGLFVSVITGVDFFNVAVTLQPNYWAVLPSLAFWTIPDRNRVSQTTPGYNITARLGHRFPPSLRPVLAFIFIAYT